MKHIDHKKFALAVLLGFVLLGCSSPSSSTGGNVPSEEDQPQNAPAPASSGGQAAGPNRSEIYVQLPLAPEIAPSDVIQQMTWVGGGAGNEGPSCDSICLVTEDNTVFLRYFPPDEQLRLDVYFPNGATQGSAAVYEFLTELSFETDSSGAADLRLDRRAVVFQFLVLDKNGNLIFQSRGTGDLEYTGSLHTCPGSLRSRLGAGMRAEVAPGNFILLQLEPSSSPELALIDLEEGTPLYINAGPQCAEGMVWWRVGAERTDGIYGGWVPEGNPSTWFIQPIE